MDEHNNQQFSTPVGSDEVSFQPKGDPAQLERLGMGRNRLLRFAETAERESKKYVLRCKGPTRCRNAKQASYNAESGAADKFRGQKSISSDQYFGRNTVTDDEARENAQRLRQFAGQGSISSAQFFGREEEEEMASSSSGVGMCLHYLSAHAYSGYGSTNCDQSRQHGFGLLQECRDQWGTKGIACFMPRLMRRAAWGVLEQFAIIPLLTIEHLSAQPVKD